MHLPGLKRYLILPAQHGLNRYNGTAASTSSLINFSYSLKSPLTFWDSFSRRGSAAARWPRQRRRWRWRTKFCFPANPCLTKGRCIPSWSSAGGKIQFIVALMPFPLGRRGKRWLVLVWAVEGQSIPFFGPAAPSLPLLDVTSRAAHNGLLPR